MSLTDDLLQEKLRAEAEADAREIDQHEKRLEYLVRNCSSLYRAQIFARWIKKAWDDDPEILVNLISGSFLANLPQIDEIIDLEVDAFFSV